MYCFKRFVIEDNYPGLPAIRTDNWNQQDETVETKDSTITVP